MAKDFTTPSKPSAPRAYKLATAPSGGWVEIAGLGFKVTHDNVNKPNIIKAVQQAERRLGRQIIGVDIVLAD